MTLMFHRKDQLIEFLNNGKTIKLIRNGIADRHGGFDVDSASPLRPNVKLEDDTRDPIYNLIVTTKAPFTANALNSIKHRLRPDSTIVLTQNGMGLVEELNETVFPDVETRPQYIIGIVSHGALNKGTSSVEHTGIGNIALTALPKRRFEEGNALYSPVTLLPPSARYLLRTLTRTSLLGGISLSTEAFFMAQLEKLANNCVINPLTAILGCRNGDIQHYKALKLTRLLLAEISLVFRALPELQDIPGIEDRFSPSALEHNLRNLITTTSENHSSMLQDINKGRLTEINYMNGYVFRRGEALGIRSMVNYTVMSMVVTKSLMTRAAAENMIPLSGNDHEADLG